MHSERKRVPPPTDRCPGGRRREHRVTRLSALLGLMFMLLLALTWELSTPDSGGPASSQPGGPPRSSLEQRPGIPPDGSGTAILADLAASIAAWPLFSPSRHSDDEVVQQSPMGTAQDGLPRLSGVVVGPTGGRAIFTGADGKSHTAAEGDMVGAFKVRLIGPGVVTLSGSDGERVLHPTFIAAARPNTAAPAIGDGLQRRREGGR